MMSRIFVKNTSNYMTLPVNAFGSILNGAPAFSAHAWIYPFGVPSTDNFTFMQAWNSLNQSAPLQLSILGGSGGLFRIAARSQDADGAKVASSITRISPFKWTSCGGIADYTNKNIKVFLNGRLNSGVVAASFGSNTYTNSASPTLADQIGYGGAVPPADTTGQFNGLISDVAVWKIALSDGQWKDLARGINPLCVARSSLVFYMPLIGRSSPEPDLVSSQNGTINGTLLEGWPPSRFVNPIITSPAIFPTGAVIYSLSRPGAHFTRLVQPVAY